MKKVLLFAAISFLTFTACNNTDNTAASHKNHSSSPDKTGTDESNQPEDAKTIQPRFANLDAGVSSHIKTLFDHYIHVKTALVNGNAPEAKNGAAAILHTLKSFDRSLLSTEQKSAYDKSIAGIRTAAEGIAANNNIAKQREYFAQLSNSAYELAKSFGAGKTLYHDHCPMAFNQKGAMWLSEVKQIRNPYLGGEMQECGSVEEVIQNTKP